MVPPGPTACLRTTPSSAYGMNLAVTQRREKLAEIVAELAEKWNQWPTDKAACEEWLASMDDAEGPARPLPPSC